MLQFLIVFSRNLFIISANSITTIVLIGLNYLVFVILRPVFGKRVSIISGYQKPVVLVMHIVA